MTTYDSDAYIIESAVAFSLVDPTLVGGRTHRLHNNSNAAIVVSSTGATPFVVGGVNSATLTLPAGQSVEVVSNATRWAASAGPTRSIYAGSGVSDASGNVTLVFPTPFAAPPIVVAVLQTTTTNLTEARVTAISATQVTVNARQTAGINVALLGLTLLGLPVPLPGVPIHVIATPAGQTP